MPRRRALALVLVLYLGLDVGSPWVPGLFFFANDDLFIGTVVDGSAKTRSVPSGTTEVPRARDGEDAVERAPRLADLALSVSPIAPGERRLRPFERSSLPPSSPDDH